MKKVSTIGVFSLALFGGLATGASAQFTGTGAGPASVGRTSTAAQARDARLGTYLTLTGAIASRERENYFTFRDATPRAPSAWRSKTRSGRTGQWAPTTG